MKPEMDLHIISTEIIKPSSPTPQQQRTHKLSLLDQLGPGAYLSLIFFYSSVPSPQNTIKTTSDHLKKSLSQTLTHFYPFAGQLKDNLFVDCNDQGVTFIETRVASDMSQLIKEPEFHILQQLLPCKSLETRSPDQPEHNLIVQANYFMCSGVAIGICFHHKLADAVTAANFLKSWGMLARGANKDLKDVKISYDDINTIYTARDLPNMTINFGSGLSSLESVVKRFKFDGNKIASLRQKIVNDSCLDRPTRFEVVSSVILGARLAAYKGSDNDFTATKNVTAFIAVNLRKRMNPPLSEQSFGNVCSSAVLNLPIDGKKINYSSLAGEIRGSIRMVDDESARKLYGEGKILNIFSDEGFSKNRDFAISSWCKMPLYQADFGWGKPMWVCNGMRLNDVVVLLDCCDGEGLEAWVGLPEQDMALFEQDPGVLAYTSL